MSTAFAPVSLPELDELLRHFAFRRPVKSVLLRVVPPTASADSAAPAQLTVDADGLLRPAGTWGALGDTFVIDAAGGFGAGNNLALSQQSAILEAVARIQHRFDLAPTDARVVHNGSKPAALSAALRLATPDMLKKIRAALAQRQAPAPDGDRNFPFPDSVRPVWALIEKLKGDSSLAARRILEIAGLTSDAEDRDLAPLPTPDTPDQPRELRDLTPELMNDLRPHVVNLTQGRFSTDGAFRTTQADVDDIFATHLPDWAASRPAGEPLRIVIYAHGGLVSEEAGLAIAANQVEWWKDNGVYPLHFVWETGLFETIGQLLNPNRRRALDLAAPTDFLLEQLARTVGGDKIWSSMKRSAERASDADGGARYVATQLAAFCKRKGIAGNIELHAVGHSAGSIFHAHFIPAALQAKTPAFTSLQLLAPAIRVDTFNERLEPLVGAGKGIDALTMFTMARPFELADNCAVIYRKSLLYLIRAALEPERRTPILGLEESLRADAGLRRLFNLDGAGAPRGEIVFSVTNSSTGRASSTSRSHGGFDNDAPTMNSIARRILGRDDIKPFADVSREAFAARDLAQRDVLRAQLNLIAAPVAEPARLTILSSLPPAAPATTGRRRALCVGIDRYPAPNALGGCVNDARDWAGALTRLGFTAELLLDQQATRAAIVAKLDALVRGSQAGDTLVFQYAGHGSQVPDLNGDEADSTDEALCPVDFASGNFLIDDDLGAIFDRIPAGVNLTMFADCCHSGTITRFAVGTPATARAADSRVRYLVATAAMKEAHARNRAGSIPTEARSAGAPRREVLFCACRSTEVALESAGHGAFTTRAVPLLAAAFAGSVNRDFSERVISAFGPSPEQHPELHCVPELVGAAFLQPPVGAAPVPAHGKKPSGKRGDVEQALAIVSAAALASSQ